MKQKLTLEYDPIDRTIAITENEFTTFEVFGILEAAKHMIANGWLKEKEDDE